MAVSAPEASGEVGVSPDTRRGLLSAAGAAAAGAAGLALGACGGPTHHHPKSSAHVASEDVALLLSLYNLERKTIAAYEAGIPLLSRAAAKDAEQFLGQEESHAGELSGLLKKVKVKAPPLYGGAYTLGHPRTETQVLKLFDRLENQQLAAYLDAIPRLSTGPVRSAAAAIFANDAQHVMVLRVHMHRPPDSAAFVVPHE